VESYPRLNAEHRRAPTRLCHFDHVGPRLQQCDANPTFPTRRKNRM